MPTSTPDRIRLHVYYSGQVQGVGFRHTTTQLARRYPVGGFVKNLPDGRVELVVEGSPADVHNLLSDIEEEMEGYIRDTQKCEDPPTGVFSEFRVRH